MSDKDSASRKAQIIGSVLVALLIALAAVAVVSARLPAIEGDLPELNEQREEEAERLEEQREEDAERREEREGN